MLDHHVHLFGVEKTKKSAVKDLVWSVNQWHLIVPFDALGARKQCLHELALVGLLDDDMSIPNARTATRLDTFAVTGDDGLNRRVVSDLDKSIHGLASTALHDDVDCVVGSARRLADKAGGAANTGDDLILGRAVRNLGTVSIRVLTDHINKYSHS